MRKVFPTFGLLSSDFSECFLPEVWLVWAEQPTFEVWKSFERKLQYPLHFVDLFSPSENLLSDSQISLNTHLSFSLDISILVYNETNKPMNMLKQFWFRTKMLQGERHIQIASLNGIYTEGT